MDNKTIIRQLRQTVQLMELHGANEFKIKSYNNAMFNLEREPVDLGQLTLSELSQINGVGKSIATAIDEINHAGQPGILIKYLEETPQGLIELLSLKGIGAKKIRVLWQELQIENSEDLLKAIDEGRLAELKGFGEKTQNNIREAVLFRQQHHGKLLYAEAEILSKHIKEVLTHQFPEILISESGQVRRKLEVIEEILFIVAAEAEDKVKAYLANMEGWDYDERLSSPYNRRGHLTETATPLRFRFTGKAGFYRQLFLTTGSMAHLYTPVKEEKNLVDLTNTLTPESEEEVYATAGLPYIEPELREGQFEFQWAKNNALPRLIELGDLKGVLHTHSTYSDGRHTIKEMAGYCQELGYEYLGITDHSKSSFYYANGLYENRVKEQHIEIDALNKTFNNFRIFKGIECDILPDGTLDYGPETLATFDFIVISVHSVLNMDIEKATQRLIRAIENPYTTILGHMTGRLLLQRDGYPVDHRAVIEACAKNNVVIEINAHPRRLDIDWRWVHHALDKGVMLSINPDAHAKEGFHDMYYGICTGRKGGLTKEMNLNSMSLKEIEKYLTPTPGA